MTAARTGGDRLAGRVAIVTGASSGLGERFVHALSDAGATVIAVARRASRLDDLAAAARPGSVMPLVGDVTDPELPLRATALAKDAHGGLHILVNNAGISNVEPAEDEPVTTFARILEVNLTAPFAWAQASFGSLRESGAGSIVNVTSALGLVGIGRMPQAAYCASKGGLTNLTRELAAQWAKDGIRVNNLAPGWFPSEMTSSMMDDEQSLRFIERTVPQRRPGRIEELDGALVFLASDASSYVTGQTLVVDGGWTAV